MQQIIISQFLEKNKNDIINPNILYNIKFDGKDMKDNVCIHEHYSNSGVNDAVYSYIKELCVITDYNQWGNKKLIVVNPISSVVYNGNKIVNVSIKKNGSSYVSNDNGQNWYFTIQNYDEHGNVINSQSEEEYLKGNVCDKIQVINLASYNKSDLLFRYYIKDGKLIEHNGTYDGHNPGNVNYMNPPNWCYINQ
jgi:hypothetical protein